MENNINAIVKDKVEQLLFKYGFQPTVVQLLKGLVQGVYYDFGVEDKIDCYKRGDLYCCITFTRHGSPIREVRADWVVIEYAISLHDAERDIFEDGDLIPLDIPIEQVLSEIEEEIILVLSQAL